MGKSSLLFYVLGCLLASTAFGKTIYYGTEAESITVVYGSTALIRFDQQVKTISQASRFNIGPADAKSPDYSLISVEPRFRRGQDHLTFLLANDAVVNLKIRTTTRKNPENDTAFFDFIAKKSRLDPEMISESGSNVSELELMKAIIRSDRVVGYKARDLVKMVHTGMKGLKAKLVKYYSGSKFNGYVFKIENTCDEQTFAIDLKSLSLGRPNAALLSQTDEKILNPKGKGPSVTYLRIVAKPTSIYRTITLPVAPIKTKQ